VSVQMPIRMTGQIALILLLQFCAQESIAQPILIKSITLEGNRAVATDKLKRQMRACREGGPFNPEALKWDLQQVELYYGQEGFLKAALGPPVVEIRAVEGKQSATVRIPVSEGALYVLSEIGVRGSQLFPTDTILSMCPIRKGQPYSRRAIDEWRDKINEAYRTMGYLRFGSAVAEDVREPAHAVGCTLLLEEGKAYTVGKISVSGDDSIDRVDFKRHILISEGGAFNPDMIPLTLQFLNQMGVYKPVSPADVETRIDDAHATVELIFHLARAKK
jgi:outer membrane protein insertion porin family